MAPTLTPTTCVCMPGRCSCSAPPSPTTHIFAPHLPRREQGGGHDPHPTPFHTMLYPPPHSSAITARRGPFEGGGRAPFRAAYICIRHAAMKAAAISRPPPQPPHPHTSLPRFLLRTPPPSRRPLRACRRGRAGAEAATRPSPAGAGDAAPAGASGPPPRRRARTPRARPSAAQTGAEGAVHLHM